MVVTRLSTSRSGLSAPSSQDDALAAAYDERVDHHPELVDQTMLDQRLYQLRFSRRRRWDLVTGFQRGRFGHTYRACFLTVGWSTDTFP